VALADAWPPDLPIPLGTLTVVEGISGSGKSSLLTAVHDAVGASLARVEDPPDEEDVEPRRETRHTARQSR